jgi:ornithine carbamoyltransferase
VKRDFLRLADLSLNEHQAIFDRARQLKERRRKDLLDNSLSGRTLVLLFEKPSTRTRLSFEAAMFQLGGSALTLNAADSQLGRGETIEDTARVISRYADAIMLRTFGDDRLRQFAAAATVPVINGLSDGGHPVQLLADLFTVEERLGPVKGKKVAFVGDGTSNMARSWAEAAHLLGFSLKIAAPASYRLPEAELRAFGVQAVADPGEGVRGADVIATDVWTSMGQEDEAQKRRRALRGFSVDEALLGKAKRECIVLHCLPAHRGEEISSAVLDGPQSAVFDEAENRLHVQKALLEQLILR